MDPHVELMFTPKKGNFIARNELKVRLSEEYNRKPLPEMYENTIDKIWNERVKENPKLWNGTKYRIDAVTDCDSHPVFNLGITDYKEFICTNWSPHAQVYHRLGKENHDNKQAYMSDALGVGSLVKTCDGQMILLRRSVHCGEAQGLWDIPGGHPEPQELVGKLSMSQIDMSSMDEIDVINEIYNSTLREIVDEVNIPLDTLTDPLLMGIARNTTSAGRPSSEYYVKCSLSSGEIRERYMTGCHAEAEESTGLMFVPMTDVLQLQNHDIWSQMAPSAKGCVTLYQTAMNIRAATGGS